MIRLEIGIFCEHLVKSVIFLRDAFALVVAFASKQHLAGTGTFSVGVASGETRFRVSGV